MIKSKFSNNVKNNSVASSSNKVKQNEVNVGSYKNREDSIKNDGS